MLNNQKAKLTAAFLLFALIAGSIGCGTPESAVTTPAKAKASFDDLVALFKEFREFQRPKVVDGVPDYTPAAMAAQRQGLAELQGRLAAMDISEWPVSRKVDYLLVRAEMNGLEFDHRVLRPWSRDPAWYIVVEFQFGPKMWPRMSIPRLPIPQDRLPNVATRLRAIPSILAQARTNLTEPTADLTMLGIRSKEREGRLLREFVPELAKHHPELVPDAEKALAAVDDFKSWLEGNKERWTARSGIGVDHYNWYLKNVSLLPYTHDQLVGVSEREYERALSMIAFEKHRNRRLPPHKAVTGREEYLKLFNEGQEFLLDFLKSEELFTVPDFITLNPVKSWNRGPVKDYFAQVQDRDPLPLMPHDFIGHGPDAIRHRNDSRPIRGTTRLYFIDGVRAEAVATGMEEIMMHVGLLDKRPRARELDYNLLGFRASRSLSDLKIHSNELTLMEGFQYNIEHTPEKWLPEDSPTMWHDIELYLRQPTYGVGYLIGSVQLQGLIADESRRLGDAFVLKNCLDAFFAAGMIPIALTRWEMTGLDDQIRRLWPEGFGSK